MSDHSKYQALAAKLIAKHGRSITLIKRSVTPTDSSKPWLGSTDTIASATTLDVTGVFVGGGDLPSETSQEVSENNRRSRTKFLVAGDDTDDLKGFDEILDNGTIWRILNAKLLQPGSQRIIWELEVAA